MNSIVNFINYISYLVLVKWNVSPEYKTISLCEIVGYDPLPSDGTLSFLKIRLDSEFEKHDHIELDLSNSNFGLSAAFLENVVLNILSNKEYRERYHLGQLSFSDDSNGMYVNFINNKMAERE